MAARRPNTVTPPASVRDAAQRETTVVRSYLEGLRSARPKRGRQRTVESVQRRLDEIESSKPNADVIGELKLAQEKLDLISELAALRTAVDISARAALIADARPAYDALHANGLLHDRVGHVLSSQAFALNLLAPLTTDSWTAIARHHLGVLD